MKAQLTEIQVNMMYAKQASLNQTMGGPAWRNETEANQPFIVATLVELIEAIQHINYKWWVKETPDTAQAQMEVVDMTHFIMSFGIRAFGSSHAAMHMVKAVELCSKEESLAREWFIAFYEARMLPTYSKDIQESKWYHFLQLNQSCLYCLQKTFNKEYKGYNLSYLALCYNLLGLAESLELDQQDIYKRYIGKHALNGFRQSRGSKTHGVAFTKEERNASGGNLYLKIWTGQEDNEHLHTFLQNNPEATEKEIVDFLSTEYEKHI